MDETAKRVVLVTNVNEWVADWDRVLQEEGYQIVAILTSPGKGGESDKHLEVVRSARPAIDVLVSNFPSRFTRLISIYEPDLLLCAGFPWLIPVEALAVPKMGAINVHGSLLPKYRGPNPWGWPFRNGDTEIGCTYHWMDGGFDTGNILAQGRAPIGDEDGFDNIDDIFDGIWEEPFRVALKRAAAGDPGDLQDESQASEAPEFEEAWKYIDWNRPARQIHNQVRSWLGAGAIAEIDGEQIKVIKTRIVDVEAAGTQPGKRIGESIISCGVRAIEIIESEPI